MSPCVSLEDMLYDKTFRKDLFVKGKYSASPEQLLEARGQLRIVLPAKRTSLPEKLTVRGMDFGIKMDMYEPVLDYASQGPVSLAEIVQRSGLEFSLVLEIVLVLLSTGIVVVAGPELGRESKERVIRFNIALDEILDSELFFQLFSSHGTWFALAPFERIYTLAAISGQDPEQFTRRVLKERGWSLSSSKYEQVNGAWPDDICITEEPAREIPVILRRHALL